MIVTASAAHAIGLYLTVVGLTFALHLARSRVTLAPLFALGVVETLLVWQLAHIGWWADIEGQTFNAPLVVLVPALVLAAGLVYAMDGTRATRAFTLTLAAAAVASIAHAEFMRSLAQHMPMPSYFLFSFQQQLWRAISIILAAIIVCIIYESGRKVMPSALALGIGTFVGVTSCLVTFSFLNYGFHVGMRNLRLEMAHYLVAGLPVALAAAAYGVFAGRRALLLPARPISEMFSVWRSAEHQIQEVRQDFLQARETIDELRRLNQRLEMEQTLRQYQVDQSPLAILELNDTGAISRRNAAAQGLFGMPATVSGSVDAYLPGFSRFLKEASGFSAVFEYAAPAGARLIQATVMPIRLGQRLHGFSVIAEDVTSRERAKTRQQVAERVKGIQMTGKVIAHDLSNLMLAIEGNLERLRGLAPESPSPEISGSFDAIATAARRGREMLRQLGTQQPFQLPELKAQDLSHLVAEAVHVQAAGARAGGIALGLDGREEDIWADIDATQVLRVLINIIGNAVRATPRGGAIAVSLRRDGGGGALITVRDTGHGMTPEQLAVAFEPSFSTRAGGQGGLGLAISYLIIDAHGGRLSLASEPGTGTTVEIWLPATDPAQGDAVDLPVLLAIGSAPLRSAILATLTDAGCDVLEVRISEEADAILEEDDRHWSLVVLEDGFPLSDMAEDVLSASCRIIVARGSPPRVVDSSACAPPVALALVARLQHACRAGADFCVGEMRR